MPAIEESIVVNRPRNEVFDFIFDPNSVPQWNSNVVEYERLTEGPFRKGSQTRSKGRVLGKTIESTFEVVEFEENRRVASRTIESPISAEGEYRFEDANGGTRITAHLEAEIPGGFFGKLADPLAARMYAKDLRASLEKLKELLEAQ